MKVSLLKKIFLTKVWHTTVDAPTLEDASEQAGIKENDSYEINEGDDFGDRCHIFAITDDILFGE